MGATCKTPTERLHEYTKHTYDNRNKHLQSEAQRSPHYITSFDQNEICVHTNMMTKIMQHRA